MIKNISSFVRLFIKRHSKLFSVLVFLFAVGFVLLPNISHALGVSDIGKAFYDTFLKIFNYLCLLVLTIFAWFLWLCGTFLDYTITYTIVKMSSYFTAGSLSSSVNTAWKFFRDIVNIVFIFVLIYVGIKTILSVESADWKRTIRNIIIAGLFINFSLFFTKLPIDVSNIVSLQLYKSVVGDLEKNDGISTKFVKYLKLSTGYATNETGGVGTVSSTGKKVDPYLKGSEEDGLIALAVKTVFGSILMFLTALVFIAAAFMFIYRFGILIFTMIISPFFFLEIILPNATPLGKKWKENLFSQCLFPVYFFGLLFVVILFLQNGALDVISRKSDSIANGLTGDIQSMGGILINYILIMFMIIGSLTVARKQGALGGEFLDKKITGMPDRLQKRMTRTVTAPVGLAGRQTIGRTANSFANSTTMKKWSSGSFEKGFLSGISGMAGRAATKKVQDVGSKTSFESGVTGGFTERRDKTLKAEREAQRGYDNKQTRGEIGSLFKKIDGGSATPQELDKLQRLVAGLNTNQLEGKYENEVMNHEQMLTAVRRGWMTSEQFAHVVSDKSERLDDREKNSLKEALLKERVDKDGKSVSINDQIEQMAKNMEAFNVETKEVVDAENKLKNAKTYDEKQSAERILNKHTKRLGEIQEQLDKDEENMAKRIKGYTDKEIEALSTFILNNSDTKTYNEQYKKLFIAGLSEKRSNELAKNNSISEDTRTLIKGTRKAILQKPLDEYNRLVANGENAEKARNIFLKKFRAASTDQISTMDSEFLTSEIVAENVEGKHLKKMLEKIDEISNMKDPKDPGDGGEPTSNTIEYIWRKKVALKKAGKNPKAYDFVTKADNAGYGNLDLDEIKNPSSKKRATPSPETINKAIASGNFTVVEDSRKNQNQPLTTINMSEGYTKELKKEYEDHAEEVKKEYSEGDLARKAQAEEKEKEREAYNARKNEEDKIREEQNRRNE